MTAEAVAIDNHVESAWLKLKGLLLDAVIEVCSLSKNHQWRPDIWWWDEEVAEAVQEKRAWFKVYIALKKGGKMAEAQEAKTA